MRSKASTWAAAALADLVAICIPSATVVAQARTNRPFDSTVRNRPACTVDQIDEKLAGLGFLSGAVNDNLSHSFSSPQFS
jgi:hypothetical protein